METSIVPQVVLVIFVVVLCFVSVFKNRIKKKWHELNLNEYHSMDHTVELASVGSDKSNHHSQSDTNSDQSDQGSDPEEASLDDVSLDGLSV